jgi:hypothetical protein
MEQTGVAPKPRPMWSQYKVGIRLLIHSTKGCCQSVMPVGPNQYSSGHFIETASLLDLSTQIMEPMAAKTQPSPTPSYQVYILLLIQ